MPILNALIVPSMQPQSTFTTAAPTFALTKLKADHAISLLLSTCIVIISTLIRNPALVEILLIAFIATSFEQPFLQLIQQLKKHLRLWQVIVGVGIAAIIIGFGTHPVNAQTAGGLFNPLSQQTNSVLTSAGAGQAGSSVLGMFNLMNIVVTIAGVGAVVYGAYQQGQGHTLRESFTPLALVMLVYIGCSFVMRLFLGTSAA